MEGRGNQIRDGAFAVAAGLEGLSRLRKLDMRWSRALGCGGE